MKTQDIICHECGKFILTEQQESFAGDIKCVRGNYMDGVYDETKDVFYCKECAAKLELN